MKRSAQMPSKLNSATVLLRLRHFSSDMMLGKPPSPDMAIVLLPVLIQVLMPKYMRKSSDSAIGRVAKVPLVCGTNALRERDSWPPAERGHLAHVEQLARRAVGLGGVPKEFALETDDGGNHLRQFADGQVIAAPQVDELGRVVRFHE